MSGQDGASCEEPPRDAAKAMKISRTIIARIPEKRWRTEKTGDWMEPAYNMPANVA